MSETARFAVPQVRLGHTLDASESWLLPRRVGVAQAARMSLLGEPLTGAQAHRHGMAGWLVGGGRRPRESVAADPRSVARPARTGRAAATKRLLASLRDGSLADQLDREVRESAACAATDEFMDAITAVAVRTQRRST
ncbi:enoyl-CoA hydratase/isomerase family protein [Rhodococcus baikonurensis]|uniref:enoyl-CoA hydratase/isomerase family protein n=1 Tax=Rhodococcus baikonurensis TaxID=172041 RepID=UPI0037914DFA